MKDKVTRRSYSLLRLFSLTVETVHYAHESRYRNRTWYLTENRNEAYKFQNRSEARTRLRLQEVQRKLREDGWFWEIVKVTETTVTSFNVELVVSDAPAMVQLGRAAL